MPPYRPIKDRFEEKFVRGTEDECWEWTAALTGDGYGIIGIDGKPVLSHREAYRLYKGDPTGHLVCHSCDNRKCVNPKHLWLGDVGKNNNDRHSKGRSRGASHSGEANPSAKINADIAREIFAANGSYEKLGKRFGLNWGTIRDIRKGKIWSHATSETPLGKGGRTQESTARGLRRVG